MASKAVVDAVSARLAANWTATPVIPLNEQGEVPVDGSAFLTVQYPIAQETHVGMSSIGFRTFREEGAMRFVLSVPRGAGVTQALTWAEQIRNLFRAAQFGGVSCLAPAPAFFDDSNDRGAYFVLSIVLEYYYDLYA